MGALGHPGVVRAGELGALLAHDGTETEGEEGEGKREVLILLVAWIEGLHGVQKTDMSIAERKLL